MDEGQKLIEEVALSLEPPLDQSLDAAFQYGSTTENSPFGYPDDPLSPFSRRLPFDLDFRPIDSSSIDSLIPPTSDEAFLIYTMCVYSCLQSSSLVADPLNLHPGYWKSATLHGGKGRPKPGEGYVFILFCHVRYEGARAHDSP